MNLEESTIKALLENELPKDAYIPWNAEDIGYTPITTFWDDFAIADRFGVDAIKDTYKRAFNEWKTDYKYLTELIMVLNHKSWAYSEYTNTQDLARLYAELYEQADRYACTHLKDEELSYYYEVTD